MVLNGVPPLFKLSVFVFLFGIYVTSLYYVSSPATILQLVIFRLLIQFLNRQIFFETHVDI
jgi:hypothetical protein